MKSMRRVPGNDGPRGRSVGPLATVLSAGVAAAIAALLPAAGCHRAAPRPDVLLVTIDTLRRDHCSLYGYAVPTTPNLDALAARGLRFERAYAESSTTAPSHAVLMTGRHFRSSGVRRNASVLALDAVTLAEVLGAEGYRTAAFVSSFPLRARFGFSQGFDVYDDAFARDEASLGRRKEGAEALDRYAGATLDHVSRWLASNTVDGPLFLWVHLVDPHAPYEAPENFEAWWPEDTEPVVKRYDAEVHYADAQLGRLLALLDERRGGRERLAVVTSDHGEGLGDHGWMFHGVNLYEEAVRVPMVASWPGRIPAGAAVETPVGLVDVARGVLGLLGIAATTFADGEDLFAAGAGRAIYLQRGDPVSSTPPAGKGDGEMTGIVRGDAKFLAVAGAPRRELYNLKADPSELVDLLGGPSIPRRSRRKGADTLLSVAPPRATPTPAVEALAQELDRELAAWRREHAGAGRSEAPLGNEDRESLRALGYVD